jgi:glycosyltransferase involved in cell wall biosynthesis
MKVSVLMITYNQEEYIAQALDSVLMQEVDFDYEIVIGEDFSTDGTRGIVLDYQRRHPEKIRLLLAEKNLGMIRNLVQTYDACEGEYVAILEGDDYWTSSAKLQKQAKFLDENRGTALCFHTTNCFYDDGSAPSYLFPAEQKEFSTIEDLLEKNYIQTCSVMFRNRLFGKFPDWFFASVLGDYPLHLLNAGHGGIGYINEVMAAYRIHSAGVWSMQMEKNFVKNVLAGIEMYSNLDTYFHKQYHSIIKRKLYEHELALYKWHLKKKNYGSCSRQAIKIMTRYPGLLVSQKVKYELGRHENTSY